MRIAVGKKLFKKGCELSFQLGTRNPYILFSFLDGKGKKKEHSVHLKDDELKELRYYVDGDDEADEANDIDDAMSVIAFRITPSEKNDFAKYPNVYDPDESGGAKIEKRYIVVELRDSDDLQVSLTLGIPDSPHFALADASRPFHSGYVGSNARAPRLGVVVRRRVQDSCSGFGQLHEGVRGGQPEGKAKPAQCC